MDDLLHIKNPRTLSLINKIMNLRNALIKTGFRTKVPITEKEGEENSLIIILLQQ